MGQLFSDKYNDEYQQDMDPDFTMDFKNVKVENNFISQEVISCIDLYLKNGNIQGASIVINDVLKEMDKAPLNIAVTGESGAGKSSFINALRGVEHGGEDAAPIGMLETTMQRTPYKHPNFPKVIIWDLPGTGTINFQPKHYLEKVKL
jgi:predicted GTPase